MSVYRCLEPSCRQPISREMAVLTSAGGYTGGYCQKDAVRREGAIVESNENLHNEQEQQEAAAEATEQTAAAEEATEQEAVAEPAAAEPAIGEPADDSR